MAISPHSGPILPSTTRPFEFQISIYQPDAKNREVNKDAPPPAPKDCQTSTYDTLPAVYWKKYQYAYRFVNLVRSSTPKITLFSERAKCMLKENLPSPDFEVQFTDGANFKTTEDGTKIIQRDGTTLTLDSRANTQHLSQETRELLSYVNKVNT